MSDRPTVVKLGGDALASPERIAAQARHLACRAAGGPVVAVASARRGVTDHLLRLTVEVAAASRPATEATDADAARGSRAEADRAVAAGEVVAASLLALALNQLGVPAMSLDAREAGVLSIGKFGKARIKSVTPRRIRRLLDSGVVPVVTGFQGWQRGRVATLGRGGTDTSAVALGCALHAQRVVFVKEAHGLRTADPRLVPDAAVIAEAPHGFLAALAAEGSKVVQLEAALLAERHGLPLEFWSLEGAAAQTLVHAGADGTGLRAVATATPAAGEPGKVTVIGGNPAEAAHAVDQLRAALTQSGITPSDIQPAPNGVRFVLPAAQLVAATQALHRVFVIEAPRAPALRAS
ncbi:MAG TPA: hypothetical protein VLD58_06370 [Gemmatimonadales bacterium]|nr:hypothetical protein [Gemmatimonadales bacterium]